MRGGRGARGRRRRGLGLRRARRSRRGIGVARRGSALGVQVPGNEELPPPGLRVVPEPNFLRPITLTGENCRWPCGEMLKIYGKVPSKR